VGGSRGRGRSFALAGGSEPGGVVGALRELVVADGDRPQQALETPWNHGCSRAWYWRTTKTAGLGCPRYADGV
jgi:hypothetical protein